MPDLPEEVLSGGNSSAPVVRIGTTVRKPATLATPGIQALLSHLCAAGFDGAPKSYGIDEKGRQILEYIPGVSCSASAALTISELQSVGRLICELHDAVASFEPPPSAKWNGVVASEGSSILCHNDLAPWNLIRDGRRWVWIDWDNASPGTRLWDLSYAALTFAPITPGCDLAHAAVRVRAMLDGYRLATVFYQELLRLMIRRSRVMYELLRSGHSSGVQPWACLYSEGHAEYWGPVADYVETHIAALLDFMEQG